MQARTLVPGLSASAASVPIGWPVLYADIAVLSSNALDQMEHAMCGSQS